ncbi:MAG: hypothetical protein M0017_10395 [Desulfobacteraceae bacterium]|nr:hypothetical protein [Desulfobacteraceae bacterium]
MTLFTFHGDLPSLLSRRYRPGPRVELLLGRRASVKDAVEALGPPHTEIGRLVANGREIGFEHLVLDREEIEVEPLRPPVDVRTPTTLRPAFPDIRFIADVNVGKLARLLRMLGFDTAYRNDLSDEECAATAERDKRICLSMDFRLLKRSRIVHGRLVRESDPLAQLREVVELYHLAGQMRPFSRCLRCNNLLEPVAKTTILSRLEPLTRKYYDAFERCPRCDRIYWAGSHREQMDKIITALAPEQP